jgi:4-hydroxyphenylacetate 3-monooxygenase
MDEKRYSEMAIAPAAMTAANDGVGPMTGPRYLESLRDGREVWIDGERVEDVTTHPAFRDMIGELARV